MNATKRLIISLISLTFVIGISVSTEASVKVGGSLRLETSWKAVESDWSGTDSYVDVHLFDNSKSRLTFSYSSSDKRYHAFTELGVYSNTRSNFVQTRVAKFWYSWDGGRIMFGQDFNISHVWFPHQKLDNSASLRGYGTQYIPRHEQVRLTLGRRHKVKFALEAPLKGDVWSSTQPGLSYHNLPAFAAGLELNFGPVIVKPWARYELVQWRDASDYDYYNSLDLGLGIKGDFGWVGFTGAISYGLNTAQAFPLITTSPLVVNNRVVDDVRQFNLRFELRLERLSVGYGRVRVDRDDWSATPYRQAVYASYRIPFGPMMFQPEVLLLDNGRDENGVDQGQIVMVGLYTEVKF